MANGVLNLEELPTLSPTTPRISSSPLQFLQAARDFFGVRVAVERADADIAFAFGSETASRRDDHVRLRQDSVECLPARDTFWSSHPDVWGVDAAKHFQPGFLRSAAQYARVAEIMFDQRTHLRL